MYSVDSSSAAPAAVFLVYTVSIRNSSQMRGIDHSLKDHCHAKASTRGDPRGLPRSRDGSSQCPSLKNLKFKFSLKTKNKCVVYLIALERSKTSAELPNGKGTIKK